MTDNAGNVALAQAVDELRKKLGRLTPNDRRDQSEEDVKKDFLMPLFAALGWDTENRKVKDEVVAERHVGNRKRVDYGFRLKSVTQFYLEAKNLKEDLEDEDTLDQAVNYSYLKGIPWAVVSNFQRTIVLEADSEATTSRDRIFLNLTQEKYLDQLADLALLSRGSFEGGEIEEIAERHGRKPRRKPVGEQLLLDLDRFRESLTKDILRLNREKVGSDEVRLDEAVQRILDRLLFMRAAEDRGMEEHTLHALVRSEDRSTLTSRLHKLFADYNRDYDSELFETALADQVRVDSDILDKVVRGLYSTAGRTVTYDFSVIGADILGEVYEQYLGLLLRKTQKRAELVDGGIHRKALGIYYTPTYIVQHIVEATLGEALRKADEAAVRGIRVVDPACGSGSFLLKAYDFIESWWRGNRGMDLAQTVLTTDAGEVAFSRRSEIVQQNLFGVDLDPKAAEIARLNLLLRITEQRRRLPTLKQNVRVGDSLASVDWDSEFSHAVQGGKFDVVIGNPPWSSKIPSEANAALASRWGLSAKNVNVCSLFVLQGLSLVKEGGYFGFLLPKVVIKNEAYEPVRRKLLGEFDLTRVLDFGQFPGVASDAVGIVARRTKPGRRTLVFGLEGKALEEREPIDQKVFTSSAGSVLALGATAAVNRILRKVEASSKPLGELFHINRGIELGQKSVLAKCPTCSSYNETGTKYYGPRERKCQACGEKMPKSDGEEMSISSPTRTGAYPRKCVAGRQIQRYTIPTTYFVPASIKGVDYKEEIFEGLRIFLKRIATRPTGTLVSDSLIAFNTVYSLRPKGGDGAELAPRVLGLLNSDVLGFYYEKTYNIGMNLTTQVTMDVLSRLPIREAEGEAWRIIGERSRELADLGAKIAAQGDMATDRLGELKERFGRADHMLERAVGDHYGLTAEERRLVAKEMAPTKGVESREE